MAIDYLWVNHGRYSVRESAIAWGSCPGRLKMCTAGLLPKDVSVTVNNIESPAIVVVLGEGKTIAVDK